MLFPILCCLCQFIFIYYVLGPLCTLLGQIKFWPGCLHFWVESTLIFWSTQLKFFGQVVSIFGFGENFFLRFGLCHLIRGDSLSSSHFFTHSVTHSLSHSLSHSVRFLLLFPNKALLCLKPFHSIHNTSPNQNISSKENLWLWFWSTVRGVNKKWESRQVSLTLTSVIPWFGPWKHQYIEKSTYGR